MIDLCWFPAQGHPGNGSIYSHTMQCWNGLWKTCKARAGKRTTLKTVHLYGNLMELTNTIRGIWYYKTLGCVTLQARLPQKVERDPYTGPVVKIEDQNELPGIKREENPIVADNQAFHHSRPPTRGGGRNLQDSSFALSGKHTNSQYKFWCLLVNLLVFIENKIHFVFCCVSIEEKFAECHVHLFFHFIEISIHQNFTVAFINACIIIL